MWEGRRHWERNKGVKAVAGRERSVVEWHKSIVATEKRRRGGGEAAKAGRRRTKQE